MSVNSLEETVDCDINPITLEVVCEGLIAVVREMRASIIRASYSSVIYEFDDFSCAVFSPDGEMVAQSWDHPGHVLPLPWGVRCALDDFEGDLVPGDVLMLNDPYRGGTHLNDVTIMYPVFDDAGNLMIFPAVRAHWVDVGGMVPGSYSGLSTNIYQEGVRIPPIKLVEGGRMNRSALTLLMANMRVPEEREGDLNASIGACKVAESRIRKLYQKYGADTVLKCVAVNLDRTERRLREKIAQLPDGDYYYEDYLEYFNDGEFDPVIVRVKLTIAGDQITVDFEGSNRQVPGVVNSSLAVTGAGAFVAIKSTLDPGGAVNNGAFRPITLKAPPGSVVDVRNDAPAGAHGEVRKRGASVTLGALSQIIPDLVSGDLCGSSFPNAIGGYNQRRQRQYVYYEAPAGGNGGFLGDDGPSTMGNIDFGNLPSIQSAESLENEMPVFIERYELRCDSGGEGTSRGGLGMCREVRLLDDEASYSVLSDRAVIPPYGVLGGASGASYCISVIRDGHERLFDTPGKVTGHPIRKHDVVTMRSSGGGGYGAPWRRDPRKVRHDVVFGYISRERARDGYGVILRADDTIDEDATTARRREIESTLHTARIVANDAIDPFEGKRGRHRVVVLSPQTAKRIGVAEHDMLEMRGRNPAPLRGWVRINADHPDNVVCLEEFARRVLGSEDGEDLVLNALAAVHVPKGLATGSESP